MEREKLAVIIGISGTVLFLAVLTAVIIYICTYHSRIYKSLKKPVIYTIRQSDEFQGFVATERRAGPFYSLETCAKLIKNCESGKNLRRIRNFVFGWTRMSRVTFSS